MKKSDLKNYIRENIISTLEEDIAADTKALEDYESKLDDVIKKKQEAGIEEQVDKFNVDVFGYKTNYFQGNTMFLVTNQLFLRKYNVLHHKTKKT